MDFTSKTVLVTGGGSGIGEAVALQLAAGGARVAILDRLVQRAQTVATRIGSSHGSAMALEADVSDEVEMSAALQMVAERYGRLDGIVANAGINGVWAPIDELSVEEWDRTQQINLRGTFLTLNKGVPLMKAAGGGAVVIVSSINGTRTFSSAGATAYSAAKAGQAAMALQLALELAPHRIRVNAVCPGKTTTAIGENTTRRNVEAVTFPVTFPKGDIPLIDGEAATPQDIADAIVLLLSDRARHVTGTLLFVDGGQSLVR